MKVEVTIDKIDSTGIGSLVRATGYVANKYDIAIEFRVPRDHGAKLNIDDVLTVDIPKIEVPWS